ncbi:peroxidase family protein [Pseudogemmobacter sp. W21_MBD1_M6]|uniref:peroxidase family protein n=1 Tax=Pseudogemmobacter sp. W21_MBD1_M6 TaxID=3240271 RepID=UPI003F9651C2
MATSFTVNTDDLMFILRQIKIAEAHSGGLSLVEAIQNEYGLSASDTNLVPFGLRTVDGTYNNLAPGNENFGAADQPFPRMLDPLYVNDTDGDAIDFDGPGGQPAMVQGDYSQPGNVIDADPRTISNLIVDQTVNNPAAILAALQYAGVTGADATAALAAIQAAHAALQAAQLAAGAASPAALAALQATIDQETTEQANAQGIYDAAVAADIYAGPAGLAAASQAAAEDVAVAINAVGTAIFGSTVDQTDIDNADAAVAAAVAAVAAAQAVTTALAGLTGEAQALSAQNEMAALLTVLQTYADGLTLNEPVSASDELQQVVDAANTADFNASNAAALTATLQPLVDPGGAVAAALVGLDIANAELAAAQDALAAAQNAGTTVATADAALHETASGFGVEIGADGGLEIPNLSPDIGLSPSFNAWMTFFGQFFDHGLDLVTKANNGTVYIPLQPDDPLITHGPDGIPNSGDEVPPHLAFMAVTRAQIDATGNAENTTTPFVDQNQTYTSHPSHQVFLRQYMRADLGDGNGMVTLSTGHLFDGTTASGSLAGAVANWGEVKAQALTMLGITLGDFDIHSAPLLATDAYGELILGPNGYAQLVMMADGTHAADWLQEGNPDGSVTTAGAYTTGHAFLNDIAHHAGPGLYDSNGDHIPDTPQTADTDPGVADDHDPATYDDEMLNAHFITGDGRGNENIALTAVHSVFHSEHNRLVEVNKETILEAANAGDIAFLNEWLLIDVAAVPADLSTLVWDGERLFQAARFVTEMQYQHLVFEEFARRIQPAVDPFVFTHSPDVDAAIVAEFAHTVYRFGHSMLTETVDRVDNNLELLPDETDQATLVEAFLNPQMFLASGGTLEEVIGNIVRGATLDVANEMDEFVVPALQSNLLGLPLDLAAINIARGRENGIPSLNEARKQFYEDYGLADLKPYTSWLDFAQHIKNPASIINFIAAYGTHGLITGEATLEGKRAAATAIVTGVDQTLSDGRVIAALPAQDRSDFLNATGAYATVELGGMNNIDFWIGGLAEELNEFGGMLGSTFNLVFEFQMEQLQAGDRFYYLSRTQGTNLLNQLEPNTFTDLVMRNSALGDEYATHLNSALFVTADHIFELDRGIAQADYNPDDPSSLDPVHDDPFQQLIDPRVVRDYTGATTIDVGGVTHDVGGYLKYSGGEHVVLGGTEGNDSLLGDKGIDTLWGDGGNDYLNAGMESDSVFGGAGDDIIEDPFGDDVLRGDDGNDVISAGSGLDLIFAGEGNDYVILGQDDKQAAGDGGDDFILGGSGNDFILGGEGNDWIEGGQGFDVISGENSQLFFNSTIIGHDVAWGQANDQDYDLESGDDIALSGPGIQRFEGMFGYDWAAAKYDTAGVNFDFQIPIFTSIAADILKDRFDQVEAASGRNYDDNIQGDDRGHTNGGSSAPDSVPVALFTDHVLDAEGIDRIDGLRALLGGNTAEGGLVAMDAIFGTNSTTFQNGNILIGGGGSDVLRGRGGYDILDGDAWLNVRIKIVHDGVTYSAESLNTDATVAGEYSGLVFNTDANGNPDFGSPAFDGRSLNSLMLDGTINPGSLSIVREILQADPGGDIDTAAFQGNLAEYEIEGRVVAANGTVITEAADVDGDGFIKVRDMDTGAIGAVVDGVQLTSRGALTDDIDLLRNIEQLQFADQTIVIAGDNNLASGLVTIQDATPFNGLVTPVVGQVLTATLTNVFDLDGVAVDANGTPTGPYSFEWQTTAIGSNGGWSTIQTSLEYTVRSVDPGQVLRAVAVFKDTNGTTERIASAATDSPTATYSVDENSAAGTIVGLQIPFDADNGAQPINGQPPADVDPTTLYHEIDPANSAGGRFTVIQNGTDINGFPRYSLVVDQGGPALLNFEAPVHTPANQSFQFVDNQYDVIINSYSDTPANGGVLVAVRQFTVVLNDVTGEPVNIVPTLQLHTVDHLGAYIETFGSTSYTEDDIGDPVSFVWDENWVEVDPFNADIQINGGRLQFDAGTDGGEMITRAIDLGGLPAGAQVNLSFDYEDDGVSSGAVVAEVWNSGTNSWNQIANLSANGDGSYSYSAPLSADQIGALSAIRFRAAFDGFGFFDNLYVDNIQIDIDAPSAMPTTDHTASFDENGAAVAIAAGPAVADADGTTIMGATVVLTNAQTDDVLSVAGDLPAGITASFGPAVAGEITMYLAGPASSADMQTAIAQVRFANTGDNPNPLGSGSPRLINVTVTDGESESTIATATVTVNATDDPAIANNDTVYTNITSGIDVPLWALLANDSDADDVLSVVGVKNQSGVSAVLGTEAVTVADVAGTNNRFDYTLAGGDTARVTMGFDTNGTLSGSGNNDIVVGNDAGSSIDAGAGNDIVFAGGGNDGIVWNANFFSTDGRDFVDGGDGIDTFTVNGNFSSETYRIYTTATALAAGLTGLNPATEIVITRNGEIIAELDNIEEIAINSAGGGGDSVAAIGDFGTTSLALNTIHINGSSGDDTVDISRLTSDHRIVFLSNGGSDTIIGNLRPQDVILFPEGSDPANTVVMMDADTGLTTATNGANTVSYVADGAGPQFTDTVLAEDDGDDDVDGVVITTDAADHAACDDDDATVTANSGLVGTGGADALTGTDAGETIVAHGGADMVFAGGGNDNILGGAGSDMLYGDGGADRIFGEAGDDFITGGAGDDTVFGGAGDDLFVAASGDGNDTYYGDAMNGGAGVDTLDMSAIMSDITADLGSGLLDHGSVYAADSGHDTLWGIENIVTGAGNDIITANAAVNVIDGGDGENIFRFNAAADADGDTVVGFQPGDKIDLSGMDANNDLSGQQTFMMSTTGSLGAVGELLVSHETREDGEYTVIEGNAGGDSSAEFKLSLKGTHTLSDTDFTL